MCIIEVEGEINNGGELEELVDLGIHRFGLEICLFKADKLLGDVEVGVERVGFNAFGVDTVD